MLPIKKKKLVIQKYKTFKHFVDTKFFYGPVFKISKFLFNPLLFVSAET